MVCWHCKHRHMIGTFSDKRLAFSILYDQAVKQNEDQIGSLGWTSRDRPDLPTAGEQSLGCAFPDLEEQMSTGTDIALSEALSADVWRRAAKQCGVCHSQGSLSARYCSHDRTSAAGFGARSRFRFFNRQPSCVEKLEPQKREYLDGSNQEFPLMHLVVLTWRDDPDRNRIG